MKAKSKNKEFLDCSGTESSCCPGSSFSHRGAEVIIVANNEVLAANHLLLMLRILLIIVANNEVLAANHLLLMLRILLSLLLIMRFWLIICC